MSQPKLSTPPRARQRKVRRVPKTHARNAHKGAPTRCARVPPPAPSFDHRQLQQPANGKENPTKNLGATAGNTYKTIREEKAQTKKPAYYSVACVRRAGVHQRSQHSGGCGVEGRGSPAAARGARGSTSPPLPPPRAHTHRASTESVHYEPFTGQELC